VSRSAGSGARRWQEAGSALLLHQVLAMCSSSVAVVAECAVSSVCGKYFASGGGSVVTVLPGAACSGWLHWRAGAVFAALACLFKAAVYAASVTVT
jgi:hypothetical protein